MSSNALERAHAFCARFGVRAPVLLAPMAGVAAPALSVAVAQAGGLGGCGALMLQPHQIAEWVQQVRQQLPADRHGAFQLNLWIPDPPPRRDPAHEGRVREFLSHWGPAVPAEAGDAALPPFAAQCEALLAAHPRVVSSIMGLYPPDFAAELRQRGISWFAAVSTVAEARAAQSAGADVIVAQGMEAGGHRACFDAARAERQQVGLFALLPAVVDAVGVPVVAAGGIADARGVAAALLLGASAVQIGTAFLRCPEAGIDPVWAQALARTAAEDTAVTRAFSGRAGRCIENDYVRAVRAEGDAVIAPYPVQRGLSAAMRADARKHADLQHMQAWAGQSASLAKSEPAAALVQLLWEGAQRLLA
ncbi:MAG: NAD(P)H-dependent flavin oxidoreductase [Steroidobacteraceae bacterium]